MSREEQIREQRALEHIVRVLLAINFVLFVLTFIPAFSGIGQPEPGLADRLWGDYRFAGWRADIVWVCATSVFIGLSTTAFVVDGGVWSVKDRRYHNTAIVCLVWLACFLVYLGYCLLHMFG